MALPRLNTPQSARRLMQTTEHRLAAYLVGSLTLAMLVTFVTLDLQAMRRESSHPSPAMSPALTANSRCDTRRDGLFWGPRQT